MVSAVVSLLIDFVLWTVAEVSILYREMQEKLRDLSEDENNQK